MATTSFVTPRQRSCEILIALQPGICETTPGVKSYAGHVRLPAGLIDDISGRKHNYSINT